MIVRVTSRMTSDDVTGVKKRVASKRGSSLVPSPNFHVTSPESGSGQ